MHIPGIAAAAATVLLLAGCSTPVAAGPGTVDVADQVDFSAAEGSWRVSGGGEWVTGETVICDTSESILIEDAAALSSADGIPVPTMVLTDGTVAYGTSWIQNTTPTGPSEGDGTYVVTGADGVPERITGSATLTWYDADTDSYEDRTDAFEFALEPVDTPGYCLG